MAGQEGAKQEVEEIVEFLKNPQKYTDPMGVDKADIDSVWLGCNGAVYLTNKVYSPTSFVSVLYPAIVNETMKVMRWAVEKNQYNVYLNSLNSRFSFFNSLTFTGSL